MFLILSLSTWILLAFFIGSILFIILDGKSNGGGKIRIGPRVFPIIGSIPYLMRFNNPCDTFSALAKDFGDTVYFKMGMLDAYLITGYENIKNIMVQRQSEFDSRVEFVRYNILFTNRANAVAFCNYSEMQRKRRDLIHTHTFPKLTSFKYEKLDSVASVFLNDLLGRVQESKEVNGSRLNIKPLLLDMIGRTFFKYFCNMDVNEENEKEFKKVVLAFDLIFQDINKGCIGDILPFLMRFCSNRKLIVEAPHLIRLFIEKYCIEPRQELRRNASKKRSRKSISEASLTLSVKVNLGKKGLVRRTSRSVSDLESLDENNNSRASQFTSTEDLLDGFLNALDTVPELTPDLAFYGLEDILGGQSAVGNFLMRAFVLFARHPESQDKIRQEISDVLGQTERITLQHRLPYTEAALLEITRHISSQIVPHSPNRDTFIDDIPVKKGAAIFFNIRDLNFSSKHWDEPDKFMPERFLVEEGGRICVRKPEYFIPYGVGKRSCLGYKMANWISFLVTANLLARFRVELDPTEKYDIMDSEDKGVLSNCPEGYRLLFKPIERID